MWSPGLLEGITKVWPLLKAPQLSDSSTNTNATTEGASRSEEKHVHNSRTHSTSGECQQGRDRRGQEASHPFPG